MKKLGFTPPYAAATLVAFLLFIINFNAVFNYGSGYDTSIIAASFIYFLAWGVGYFFSEKTKFSFGGVFVSLILFLFIAIIFCSNIFDGKYGTLDVASYLSSSAIHMDMLYHSTLAESIANYFTPSILIDGTTVRNYHFFSHIVIAFISKLTSIPPFFVYNYLYPQIFIALFVYLYFRLIQSIGCKFNCDQLKTILFGSFLLLFHILWIDPGLHIISQSYFISLIICLLYLNIFDKLSWYSEQGRCRSPKIFYITTVFFVFIVSLTKISTGVVFLVGFSWFFLRQCQGFQKKIFLLLSLASAFFASLMLCKDASVGLSDIGLHSNFSGIIALLKYVVLALLVIWIRFSHFFSGHSLQHFFNQKRTILEECVLVCFFACLFLLFVVYSGDIVYFFLPLAFLGLLACFFTMADFSLLAGKITVKKANYTILFVCTILLCIFSIVLLREFEKFGNAFLNLKQQRSIQAETADIAEITPFKKYFSPSTFFKSQPYAMLRTIREISHGNKAQYGLFTSGINSQNYVNVLAYVFYYQALTGIVRYAPLYRAGKAIYTNNDQLLAVDGYYPYYGLKKITISAKATLADAMCAAKADGKKFLFHIINNDIYLIDLTTESSKKIITQ